MLVNLKTAIAARGFSQVDFALAHKIVPSVLSEIIHERRRADSSLRARIAQALQADESWLFSGVTRIPRPQRDTTAPAQPAPAMACSAAERQG